MAWLGRRYGGLGPVWATLMILAAPIIYYFAVMLAAQVYSLANDFAVRNASVALAVAGACGGAVGAAALLLITVLRRRRALARFYDGDRDFCHCRWAGVDVWLHRTRVAA